MTVSRLMTEQEKAEIILKVVELEKQGKFEEAKALDRQIPLAPHLAKFAKDYKEYLGEDFLTKFGFNLAEADAEFGPGWFDR